MPDIPRVGLVVNPIAGMGGSVGLKGTDGVVDEAIERGAEPVTPGRTRRFLDALTSQAEVLAPSEPMGAGLAREAGYDVEVVLDVREPTSAEDTREAAGRLADAGVDLLVFVGGDGTALDVAGAVGRDVVCLGVPGGVKMNSAAFGTTPEQAARVADDWLAGRVESHLVDLVEVDETRAREGELERAELGTLLTPDHEGVQAGKAASGGGLAPIREVGRELAEPGACLVLGPGSTVHAIKEELVGQGTLLGVDVVRVDADGEARLAVEDATAGDLEAVEEARIVVSPIGGQGFVVGRGNQQLCPGLLGRLGWESLVVVATPTKLRGLDRLTADTGDPELDRRAPAYLDVVTGPGFRTRKPLTAGNPPVGR